MTAQEQQMLKGLTDRVNKTQLAEKDSDAEDMLQKELGRNPDALYILAQTMLVEQYALEQAQRHLVEARAQIDELRQQTEHDRQPRHATSFLGNLLGLNEEQPSRSAPPPPRPAPPQAQYAPAPGYAPVAGYGPAPGYVQPVAPGVAGGYGVAPQGGFLRSAMQTATGVAAGALAFEGIESLMHGFGHGSGYGSGFGGVGDFGGAGRPEEIVNNYYGNASPGAEHTGHPEHSDFLSTNSNDRNLDNSNSNDSNLDDKNMDSSRLSNAVYTEDRADSAGTPIANDDSSGDTTYDDVSDDSNGGDDSDSGSDSGTDFDSGDDSGGGDVGF